MRRLRSASTRERFNAMRKLTTLELKSVGQKGGSDESGDRVDTVVQAK